MKINLENMKKLAERLDHSGAINDLFVDDVCSMAYQLQYFFEGMDRIQVKKDMWKKSAFKDDRARSEAYGDSLGLLTNALVDKPELDVCEYCGREIPCGDFCRYCFDDEYTKYKEERND